MSFFDSIGKAITTSSVKFNVTLSIQSLYIECQDTVYIKPQV